MAFSLHVAHICVVMFCVMTITVQQTVNDEVRTYLDGYNERAEAVANQYSLASWAYYTNLTDYNRDKMTERSLVSSDFSKNESEIAAVFDLNAITDESLKRQINKILDVGISGYEDKEVIKRINTLEADMTGIYSGATWCKTPDDCKQLEPGLTDIITNSRDYDELLEAWKGWRDVSGAKMKDKYAEFVQLMNKAIKAGGKYADMGAYYRSWYEQDDFEEDVKRLFDELSPLYDQLHAYVRRKLRTIYGSDKFPSEGHIPAHIFGNMWAQQWGNIYDILEPFPGQGRESLTNLMKAQNYNVTYMYEVAEEFFMSIGMKPMPESFWRLSMLEKPEDGRNVVCHASAWDFNNGTDFRIKQCTEVTEDQLITVHHEMGHVQYYLEYLDQPYLFRRGANPGFHEGVADIVSLSFQTPEHLQKIGLLENLPNGTEGDINFLFQMALDKIAFLPFGYLIDQWRWSVYREETKKENFNRDWWQLRCRYQGISPPVARSENDFDPGAKYHIPGNTPYIRYFVSFVAQFQWHKALCELIGQTDRLHRCDIYNSTVAGQRLQEMLRMGSSQRWGKAMETITRNTNGYTSRLSAQPILDYFRPLQEWLEEENTKAGEKTGWDKTNCPKGSFVDISSATAVSSSVAVLMSIVIHISVLLF
ncbi:angiotensin-converting enzyme-like [Ruditapes philippinarum]|uniref:angiotensin-converting enzyme-like n=1 Tax=Ruditapes philippinarum TaxID=129788 RepID=UPI00295B86CC|nr:angiotensin-converting enzyme-like [Ruditapes philippinarum]XP_060560751.1 angiotensin-converting enzyme-like [Ruditapes philippinarum]